MQLSGLPQNDDTTRAIRDANRLNRCAQLGGCLGAADLVEEIGDFIDAGVYDFAPNFLFEEVLDGIDRVEHLLDGIDDDLGNDFDDSFEGGLGDKQSRRERRAARRARREARKAARRARRAEYKRDRAAAKKLHGKARRDALRAARKKRRDARRSARRERNATYKAEIKRIKSARKNRRDRKKAGISQTIQETSPEDAAASAGPGEEITTPEQGSPLTKVLIVGGVIVVGASALILFWPKKKPASKES